MLILELFSITFLDAMSQGEIDIQKILDNINRLKRIREKLLEKDLAPKGAWIHEYTVYREYPGGFVGKYDYAKWHADKPIFKRNPKKRGGKPKGDKDPKYTCHQHIGRVGSNTGLGMEPEVVDAQRSLRLRKRLDVIEKALREIEEITITVLKGK